MTYRPLKDTRGEAAELLTDLRAAWYRAKDYHAVWAIAIIALAIAITGGI